MSRFVRASKYRHVFGKAEKPDNCYIGIRLTRNAWDQNYVAANTKYIGVCWESGGGAVAVLNSDKPGRLNAADQPLISGHKGPVLGLDWHPFNESLLCTVSEDGYGRIWGIPEGGMTENIEEPLQVLKGHKRKVGTVNFHPTANNIVATTSTDFTVKIWDVEKGEAIFTTTDGHSDIIQSAAWSENGGEFVTTCKDKKIRTLDPRQQSVAQEAAGHQGVKGSRAIWMGTDRLFSVGFTRTSEREYMIWDPRSFDKPMAQTGIDSASGILMPFYDPDSRVLFLAGKGDGNVRYYEMVDESPFIYFLTEYKSSDPQRGFGFVPKRAVDVASCEIMRGLKVYNDKIEPISFTVPRKSDLFQDDIFPPTFSGEFSITAEEYAGGANGEVKKISLEDGFVAPERPQVAFNAEKKEVDKELTEKEVREQHEALTKRVAYLEAELVKRDARIKELEG
jgi:hypothetical protein